MGNRTSMTDALLNYRVEQTNIQRMRLLFSKLDLFTLQNRTFRLPTTNIFRPTAPRFAYCKKLPTYLFDLNQE